MGENNLSLCHSQEVSQAPVDLQSTHRSKTNHSKSNYTKRDYNILEQNQNINQESCKFREEKDNLRASDLKSNSHISAISPKEGTGDFTPPQFESIYL